MCSWPVPRHSLFKKTGRRRWHRKGSMFNKSRPKKRCIFLPVLILVGYPYVGLCNEIENQTKHLFFLLAMRVIYLNLLWNRPWDSDFPLSGGSRYSLVGKILMQESCDSACRWLDDWIFFFGSYTRNSFFFSQGSLNYPYWWYQTMQMDGNL